MHISVLPSKDHNSTVTSEYTQNEIMYTGENCGFVTKHLPRTAAFLLSYNKENENGD